MKLVWAGLRMPVYLYWGEDDYRLAQAVQALRDRVLDPNWSSFNYDKIEAEQPDAVIHGLNQAMTPSFGAGGRLVWFANTTLVQRCSEPLIGELERSLAALPATSHLLLTADHKPDGRSKVTKLLQKYAEIREFSTIPPWRTEQLLYRVQQAAQQVGVKLTVDSTELLAESVGNDTRRLFTELEKLRLFTATDNGAAVVDVGTIAALVPVTTQNSLQLAEAIRQGDAERSLSLIAELTGQDEPALRIVATLVKQFRTWLWVRLMVEAGERDERAIAQAAQVSNPRRIYFLQQEVQSLSASQLQQALPLLLDLEVSLKRGSDQLSSFQSKALELCQLYS